MTDDDRYPRPLGCECTKEEGDSDCPVHPSCEHCEERLEPDGRLVLFDLVLPLLRAVNECQWPHAMRMRTALMVNLSDEQRKEVER